MALLPDGNKVQGRKKQGGGQRRAGFGLRALCLPPVLHRLATSVVGLWIFFFSDWLLVLCKKETKFTKWALRFWNMTCMWSWLIIFCFLALGIPGVENHFFWPVLHRKSLSSQPAATVEPKGRLSFSSCQLWSACWEVPIQVISPSLIWVCEFTAVIWNYLKMKDYFILFTYKI